MSDATTTPPATSSAALIASRDQAIEESGWGRPFKLVQPHNAAFWVYIVGVVLGVFHFVQYYSGGFEVFGSAVVSSVILFALYTVPFWWFIHHNDRYEREPAKLATAGFVWGGFAAVFWLALPANDAMFTLEGKLLGHDVAKVCGPALTGPIIEEPAKAAGFVLLMVLAPRLVRSARDGLIIGAFVGLGFQVFEDMLYAYNSAVTDFGADPMGSVFTMFGSRGPMGILNHAVDTALVCTGIVYFVGRTPGEPRQRGKGLVLIFSGFLAHLVWNSAAGIGHSSETFGYVAIIGIVTFDIIMLIVAVKWTASQPRTWMHDLMAPEVARGVITQEELGLLAGPRKDRRRYIKSGHGHHSHVQAKHVLQAATDLAEEIARAGGADDAPRVVHARGEVARLRAS